MSKVQVIGKLSELKYLHSELLPNNRKFIRWYKKHEKIVNTSVLLAPSLAIAAINVLLPGTALFTIFNPAFAVSTVPVNLLGEKGAILLHMMVIGFVTLVVSSFLKFTGRGDFIPLVMFVGGGIILYEVIGLFRDIYTGIATMLSM